MLFLFSHQCLPSHSCSTVVQLHQRMQELVSAAPVRLSSIWTSFYWNKCWCFLAGSITSLGRGSPREFLCCSYQFILCTLQATGDQLRWEVESRRILVLVEQNQSHCDETLKNVLALNCLWQFEVDGICVLLGA